MVKGLRELNSSSSSVGAGLEVGGAAVATTAGVVNGVATVGVARGVAALRTSGRPRPLRADADRATTVPQIAAATLSPLL